MRELPIAVVESPVFPAASHRWARYSGKIAKVTVTGTLTSLPIVVVS